jgi:rhamnosyltransferase
MSLFEGDRVMAMEGGSADSPFPRRNANGVTGDSSCLNPQMPIKRATRNMAVCSSVALVVPTLNAGVGWSAWLEALSEQSLRPDPVLVVDSTSTDDTVRLARSADCRVEVIARAEFNHGGTRQLAVDCLRQAEIVVFLTQDALLTRRDALERLVDAFKDPSIGAAYGRQLPHTSAGPFGSHARLFNYPRESRIQRLEDRQRLGIKVTFISNSFAAYRVAALRAVGGFPDHVIVSEDVYVAAKMLLAGWDVAYQADAQVHHSHDYPLFEEFRRYFDIGVFYAREPWMLKEFGQAESEGARLVRSQLAYILRHRPHLIPSALLRIALRYLGYRAGIHESLFPFALKIHMTKQHSFWGKAGTA